MVGNGIGLFGLGTNGQIYFSSFHLVRNMYHRGIRRYCNLCAVALGLFVSSSTPPPVPSCPSEVQVVLSVSLVWSLSLLSLPWGLPLSCALVVLSLLDSDVAVLALAVLLVVIFVFFAPSHQKIE